MSRYKRNPKPQFKSQPPTGRYDQKDRERQRMRLNFEPFERLSIDPPRFFVYIDGYNFYGAINHFEPPDVLRLGWCNFNKLGLRLVQESFDLSAYSSQPKVTIKYFTAEVRTEDHTAHSGEVARQRLWLRCLHEETGIHPILGVHRPRPSDPDRREEKKTDVNIALEMFRDGTYRRPNGLVLVSNDLDFSPAIEDTARKGIPVAVLFPQGHEGYVLKAKPEEHWDALVRLTHLTQDLLRDCRLATKDTEWLEYLKLKVGSDSRFMPCLEYEQRLLKFRSAVSERT